MQDQRVCPGRTGKKCGVFMSPLIRDPHIHCPHCRGNKCTIDNTCIICKSWPPEQWELFAKKKSYAHSKARRDRSVSLSASPAPSVVGNSVGRPSVPPASPPPSRDQVVMGGQPSVGVSVGCVGSAPSGSVTMATGCVSDDVAASPVPPPASGGEGGQERLPPAYSPIPGLSSTRLPSPIKRGKRVDTSGSAHSGPSRSPSTERERGGKRRGKRFRSPSRYRSRSSSGERRGRDTRFSQWSRERRDRYSDLERSRRSRSPSPLMKSSKQHSRSRDFYRERSRDERDSREYRTLAPPTARGLGSAPTAPELLRSEAISRDALTRAAHRFLNRRSVLKSVQCVTSSTMLCQASRSRWMLWKGTQAILLLLALPLVGHRRLERSVQQRVCPQRATVELLAPALAPPPVMKSMRRERGALSGVQTAPLVIVASHPPEREGAAVLLLSFLFPGAIMSRSTPLTRSRTRRMVGAR